MIWIAHRGNLLGPSWQENTIEHIERTLGHGFDVEVDVRFLKGKMWLGHDLNTTVEEMPDRYLHDQRFWFHCKNVEALAEFSKYSHAKYFWHQKDDYTLTSNRKIWTFPGEYLMPGSIAVMPEDGYLGDLRDCHAICTDLVHYFKGIVL